jgi:uncharacterized protein YggU (UPF0235/DUF167 family)
VSRGFITSTKYGLFLNLRVSPGAKRTSLEDTCGGSATKLRVAALPEDGKASAELERYLAGLLGVPRSDVAAIRGTSSRDRVILVRGLQEAETRKALPNYLR